MSTNASSDISSETEPASGVTIGVDVGGTKIAAGVVDGHGAVLRTARRPTPRHDSSAVLAEVADVVNEALLTKMADAGLPLTDEVKERALQILKECEGHQGKALNRLKREFPPSESP